MQPLKITVSSTRAVCSERPDPITTGMVGLRAEFTFSEDWDGLKKTAVCAGSGVAKDVLVIQDAITVPPECLTDPASDLKIGLYGTNSTGNIVIPTVYAYCGRLFRGADPSGDTSTDYTLPIWAQLQAMMGSLDNLTTTAKENLVAAINEAAKSGGGGGGGGGGTPADVRMEVSGGYIQYSTDGGATWTNLIALSELIAPTDDTLTQSGKAADAKVTGNRLDSLSEEIANLQTSGLTTAQVNALDGMFKVCVFIKDDVSAEYTEFKTAFGIADSGGGSGGDEPVTPGVTLTSISATYSGGDVAVGTAVTDLTGIVVTAHYSDGTSKAVTGYTLDGTIAEGENTVTVIYGGKMTEFVVVGVAESGGEVTMLSYIESDGGQYIDTEVVPTFDLRYEFGYQMVKDENLTYKSYESSNNIFGACQYASNDAGSYGFMSIYTLNNGVYMNFQSISNGIYYDYNGNTPYFEQQIMHVVGSYVKNDDGTILQQLQAFTDEAHTNEPAHRDGTTTISVAAQASKIMPIIPLHLFKVNVAPGGYYKDSKFPAFVGKIAYFKVYDDVTGNLLHEFRAAKQNGVGGMYDTVTGKFHGNLGTGAFTLGEEVTA